MRGFVFLTLQAKIIKKDNQYERRLIYAKGMVTLMNC